MWVQRTIYFKDGHFVTTIVKLPPIIGECIPGTCYKLGYCPVTEVERIEYAKTAPQRDGS